MNTSTRAQENSTDQAIAAIAQALEELAPAQRRPALPADQVAQQQPACQTPVSPDPTMQSRYFGSGRIIPRLAVLALVLVGAGAVDLWWSSFDNRAVKTKLLSLAELVSGFLAPEKTHLETAEVAVHASSTVGANKAGETPQPIQTQIVPQRPDRTNAIPPELAQPMQALEQRLKGLEQGIEQIKTMQAKLARANAELADQISETQDKVARRTDELAANLKAAEEKTSLRDRNIDGQLRAGQETMASIGAQLRASQQEMDRLATSRQQRVERSASAQATNAATRPRPAPKPKSQQAQNAGKAQRAR
jgi:exonuclease VII small subunit